MQKWVVTIVAGIGGLSLALMTLVLLFDPQMGQAAVHAAVLSGTGMSIITAVLAYGRADAAATHARSASEKLDNHMAAISDAIIKGG